MESYESAVDLYAALGFVARAAAMAKVVMGIDSTRSDVLERLSLDAARKLHRSARGSVVTATENGVDPGEHATQAKRITTDAMPLIQDGSVAEGELRFIDPPALKGELMELDVSAAEVGDRPIHPAGPLSERPPPQHLALLPSMSLFAEVPKPILERLVRESRLVDLDDGERLIEKGTTADALYALIEGAVELRRDEGEPPVVLSEGDVLGISCLLDQVSYGADVDARGKTRALRMSKLLLDRLVAEHPPLADVLLEVVGRRLVAVLVRTSPLFGGFDKNGRSRVARMFEVRKAPRGTRILEAGKRSDGLYIPMFGELIARGADGTELGTLKRGRALGQQSLLMQSTSPLTAEAATDVLVLRMSAARFKQLASKNPKMIAHLEALARRPSSPAFALAPESHDKQA